MFSKKPEIITTEGIQGNINTSIKIKKTNSNRKSSPKKDIIKIEIPCEISFSNTKPKIEEKLFQEDELVSTLPVLEERYVGNDIPWL